VRRVHRHRPIPPRRGEQVGIFALVGASAQPGTPPQHVCVANTHINANTEFSDVKLWQTQYLLVEVERIVHEWIASSAGAALGALGASAAQLPVILAGDFNSTPGSTPYALLSTGFVERDAVSEDDPVGIIASLPLEHHMMLRSVSAAPARARWRGACPCEWEERNGK